MVSKLSIEQTPLIIGITMKPYFTNQRLTKVYNSSQFDFATFFSELLLIDNAQMQQLHIHRPDLLPSNVIDVDNDQNQRIYELLYLVDLGYQSYAGF